MLKEKSTKVEDEAKDEDEVEAMDEDVVVEDKEMIKIISREKKSKFFKRPWKRKNG